MSRLPVCGMCCVSGASRRVRDRGGVLHAVHGACIPEWLRRQAGVAGEQPMGPSDPVEAAGWLLVTIASRKYHEAATATVGPDHARTVRAAEQAFRAAVVSYASCNKVVRK